MLSFDKSPDSWWNSNMETVMLPLCTPFFEWTKNFLGEALGSWTTKFPLLVVVLVWWQPAFVDLHTQGCVKYSSHVSSRHLPTESVRWVLQVRKVANISQQRRCTARAPRGPHLPRLLPHFNFLLSTRGEERKNLEQIGLWIHSRVLSRAPNQWGVVEKAGEPHWRPLYFGAKARGKKSPIWFFLFLNLIISAKKSN